MRPVSRQTDIFAAIDQALDDAVDRGWLVETPPGLLISKPAPPVPGSPQDVRPGDPDADAWMAADSKRDAALYVDNALAGTDAAQAAAPIGALRGIPHVDPPPGDTSAMSPGQLHEWCRAAEVRCQWAFNGSKDPAQWPEFIVARDFYFHCRTLLMLSLERTYAHLFTRAWQEQVAALPDVETARAIEFVQGCIALDSATTAHTRHRAGALIMASGGRLARLGLIPPEAPVAVRDGGP